MNLVFIIKNRDNTPFMVVSTTPKGSTFKPMTEDAKELVRFLREEYANTPITKPELVQSMDASKIIEGPSPSGTAVQKKVALLSANSGEVEVINTLPVLSISEVLLSEFSNEEFASVLSFKAASFISDQTRSSANFEIKGVRAVWDPSLSIPGTNRRGGFRCPVGTRYGGQITDRFGRSCGWGVARRIANQIADIGERLEQRDDDKRKRRLDRRNARMIRRLGGVPETGRVEGGLRNIADRLDGGGETRAPRRRSTEREARRQEAVDFFRGLGGAVRDDIESIRNRRRPQRNDETPEVETPSARVPRNRRRDVIPETAPTPTPAPRPRRPRPAPAGQRRPQPRPRVAPQPENVDILTARDASDAGETEDFKPYVLRKYNEYAKRVREIRAGGGNAGMLTRREWYEINKDNLRDAWKDAHGRTAPLDFEPPTPQARRPRNNRRRRRQATAQGAGRAASRKPTPDDVPEPAPARPVRPARPAARRPRVQPDGRGFVTPGNAGENPRQIDLGSKWTQNQNGQWERDGYKVEQIFDANGRLKELHITAPDNYKNVMLVPANRNEDDIRGYADRLLETAKNLAEGRGMQARPPQNQPPAPPRVNLNARWNQRADGIWERDGYELEAFYDADGKLDKFVLKEPDGNTFEQGYRGRHTDTDINAAAENLYAAVGGPNVDPAFFGTDSPTPEPSAPPPPRRPRGRRAQQNAQQLKMNNLVDNHSTSMPKLQPDENKFVAVPVGNKGINTLADARRYNGPLSDIPDEFLMDVVQKRTHKASGPISPNVVEAVKSVFPSADDAEIGTIMRRLSQNMRRSLNGDPPAVIDRETKDLIKALQDRKIDFIQVGVGNGITAPQYYFKLSDDPTKWGRGYFLKKPDSQWERHHGAGKPISQHAELVGNVFAKAIGFANGSPRIVKGTGQSKFLLMDIFINNADGKVAGRYSPGDVTDARSRLFNGILNAVINVADRHNGNGDQIKGNGAIPLDFGRALFGRRTAQQQLDYLNNLGMDRRSWAGYSKRLDGKSGAAKTREIAAIRAELQADIATAAENMRKALERVDEINGAFTVLEDSVKNRRRADLVHNIDQFASPAFLDGLMRKIEA